MHLVTLPRLLSYNITLCKTGISMGPPAQTVGRPCVEKARWASVDANATYSVHVLILANPPEQGLKVPLRSRYLGLRKHHLSSQTVLHINTWK